MLETLKQLRDDLGHVHYDQSYTAPGQDPREGLFSRLSLVTSVGSSAPCRKR